MDFTKYKEEVKKLNGMLDTQEGIIDYLGTREDLHKKIEELKKKNSSNTFRIMVMGAFSSGKSSMVNALLGENILPTKALPATAIITIIRYSQNKSITIYPKKGRWKGGDSPFNIELKDLKKYCLINHKESQNVKVGNTIDTPFEKIVVTWPLDILKDGVEVIDSPGLNDPTSHDQVTKEYITSADAIIYCMSALYCYTNMDKETLEDLNNRGFEMPVFVVTYYDMLMENADGDEEEIREFKQVLTRNLEPHSRLFEKEYVKQLGHNSLHLVSNPQALRAKQNNDMEELRNSGFMDLERYLEVYLAELKGLEKTQAVKKAMRAVNKEAIQTIKESLNTVDMPLEEFEDRIRAVRQKMANAKSQAELLTKNFNLELDNLVVEMRPVMSSFAKSASGQLDVWKNEYECSVDTNIFKLKQTAQAITDEFSSFINRKIENYSIDWSKTVFVPKLNEKLKEVGKKIEKQAMNLDNNITQIKVGLNFQKQEAKLSSGTSKTAAVVYALFTGDWMTALVGGVLGGQAMARTLTCQFAVGFALGIASLFTPVGLGAFIIGGIVAMFAGVGWTIAKIKDTVCNKVIKEYRSQLTGAQKEKEITENMERQLNKELNKLKAGMKEAAFGDIRQIENQVEATLDEKKDIEFKVEEKKQFLNRYQRILEEIDKV